MDQILPPLFIAIASLTMCVGLYAFWQSLRGLFDGRLRATGVVARSERERLVEQKASLLRALKELRFERDVGKISEQDFEALDARYRAQAKKVLRALDAQLGDFRSRAASLIEGGAPAEAGPVEAGPVEASPVEPASRKPQESAPESPGVACPGCETQNDTDAVFCKKCGERLAAEAADAPDMAPEPRDEG